MEEPETLERRFFTGLQSEISRITFFGWLNVVYRVALLMILVVIAWQRSGQPSC